MLAAVTTAAVFASAGAGPPAAGGVLGAVQAGPTAITSVSPRIVTSPSARASDARATPGAGTPNSGSPAASDDGPGHAQEDPVLSVGRAAIRTWKDSFGRSRLQVIVPIRNDDDQWIHLPDTSSTYRVLDAGAEVASGDYFALPAVIGPGETAYLVDTISIPGVELRRGLSTASDIVALPSDSPAVTLSITDLRLTSGIGGGLRAAGRVQNESGMTTRRVIAGAIALGRDDRPLAAVYDTFDVGRLDPAEARAFVTDYEPGAPPVSEGAIGDVIGVAFEAGA